MVARNFSLQDLPYSRLLADPDNDREFLTLEELKPQHSKDLNSQNVLQSIQTNQEAGGEEFNVYYDLNSQQTNKQFISNLCAESNNINSTEMTAGSNFITSNSSRETSNKSNVNETVQNNEEYQKGSRKRKCSYSEVSDFDDDDAKSVRTTDENKKANHSEIEKRRRDKMNNFITELSSMIPMCHAMSRKLDKLTVLRMAVQHLKTIRGTVHSYTEGHYKPSFLSDQELKMLILQAAEGFLFVVGCDRGRILYVSESVSEVLNYSQGDLLGQSWFDILHPKDVAKIKEQLSSSDLSPRERLIDAKTMLPVKHDVLERSTRLSPGARRSFFCRMKCKSAVQVKEEQDVNCPRRSKKQTSDKKFCVIQCTGYLKSWATAKIGLEEQEADTDGECNLSLSCLVAVGRLVDFNNSFHKPNNSKSNGNVKSNSNSTTNTSYGSNANKNNNNISDPVLRNLQFTSRHAMDGKFLFVDPRATLMLGFLPQELLGTSMYEYFNHKDIAALADSHKVALQSTEKVTTPVYGLRTKHNGFLNVQSEWKAFKNPWTKDVEFMIAKNNVILSELRNFDQCRGNESNENNYDFFNQSNGREMQRMINTHIEASKIGRQIAEQVMDYQRRIGDASSGSSPDPDPTLVQSASMVTENQLHSSFDIDQSSVGGHSANDSKHKLNDTYANFTTYNHARSSSVVSLENAGSSESSEQPTTADGNDEAAMAVIMSLLEADAGLGGPETQQDCFS
ncbi:CLUMA_CG013341, isoform B [Clunio marinus]|uniref:CLUMA_CG013341, isoform B n=1 Tax=Clunio marinus TaxID=568069 RepID=A0A1J1ILV8_9DIPT|nr:CLUMA_CG013341, isoform B [Clunio marinus]